MVQFTHLHTHTPEGSLLDGFMRIDKAIEKVKANGMDALGISDHGTMSAHKVFNDKVKAAGLHPVFGMEAYQTVNKSFKKKDFEDVDYEEDENGHYIYELLTEEEADPNHWVLVESIRPVSEQRKIFNASKVKDAYMYNEVKNNLPPGEEMPKTQGMITRRVNVLIKEYEKRDKKLYIKADTKNKQYFEWFPHIGHLLLIAMNNEGYKNLLTLNAIGFKEGFYGKPRIDYEDMKKYGKNIAVSTACLGGFVPQLILRGKPEEAKKEIFKLQEFFDEVYLEIQPSHQEEQHVVNEQLIKWSEELDIPLLATSDVHMVDKEEIPLHQQIANIGRGGAGDTSEFDSDITVYDSAYLMTQEEILDHGIPRVALQNAYDLSHRCQVDFLDDKSLKFPEYEIPEDETFDSYLRKEAEKGLFELFMEKDYITDYEKYHERLEYELGVIAEKGYAPYFLIVQDYMNWARDQGIVTGPGRGSASGSILSYILRIINVDPIRHGLLFSRFLNPERPSAPDFY